MHGSFPPLAAIGELATWFAIALTMLCASLYCLDRHYPGVYRFFYGLCHRDNLSDDVQRGFIYNQKVRHRGFVAGIIALTVLASSLFFGRGDLLVDIILWPFEVFIGLVGFWIGSLMYKIYLKWGIIAPAIDRAEEKLESLDGGKLFSDAAEKIGQGVHTATTGAAERLARGTEEAFSKFKVPTFGVKKPEEPAPTPTPEPPLPTVEDGYAALRRFRERHGGA